MRNSLPEILERLLCKYEKRVPLEPSDQAAVLALPFQVRSLESNRYLIREGMEPQVSSLLLSGFVARHKETADGGRQILSIHIPGDFFNIEGSLLQVADHSVQALTRAEVATVSSSAVISLIGRHPRVGRAMWIDTLIDASIYREWILNVGRRSARQRIGHILCEFARRLEIAGLGTTHGYRFPMTQEQLADSTGLTAVHVNRTLKSLEEDELIVRHKRFIEIPDWERLRDMSGFNELYLHLDQAA